MANNTTLNPMTGGDVVADEDIAGVKYQRVKLVDGTAAGTAGVPGGANGLSVNIVRMGGTDTAGGIFAVQEGNSESIASSVGAIAVTTDSWDDGDGHAMVVPFSPALAANGQVVPTTTAGTLVAGRATRTRCTIVNRTNQVVYVGIATVTAANGFSLNPGDGMDWESQALAQVIIASGTATGYVAYADFYA